MITITSWLGREPDLVKKIHCDFYLAWPLGHSEFWFFFAKQDALSPRAYFTFFQKDTKIKLTAIRKIVQNSSSFTYFHYCFIHSPRPYPCRLLIYKMTLWMLRPIFCTEKYKYQCTWHQPWYVIWKKSPPPPSNGFPKSSSETRCRPTAGHHSETRPLHPALTSSSVY